MDSAVYRFDESECRCSRARVPARWLVATPHRRLGIGPSGFGWTPYGLRHARQMGSNRTACGLPAVSWVIFHELAFVPGANGTCRECASVIAETGQAPGGSRGFGQKSAPL